MNTWNEKENYGAEKWRMPTVPSGENLIASECGRVIGRVTYQSHWFIITKPTYGNYKLTVKHGAGEESLDLGYNEENIKSLLSLESDQRFLMLHSFFDVRDNAINETARKYEIAFIEKRIKSRKRNNRRTVWIEERKEAARV